MSGLAGRNVVVIGASSGIGRAFAIRAVNAGALEEVVSRTPAPIVGSAELMKDVSRARGRDGVT